MHTIKAFAATNSPRFLVTLAMTRVTHLPMTPAESQRHALTGEEFSEFRSRLITQRIAPNLFTRELDHMVEEGRTPTHYPNFLKRGKPKLVEAWSALTPDLRLEVRLAAAYSLAAKWYGNKKPLNKIQDHFLLLDTAGVKPGITPAELETIVRHSSLFSSVSLFDLISRMGAFKAKGNYFSYDALAEHAIQHHKLEEAAQWLFVGALEMVLHGKEDADSVRGGRFLWKIAKLLEGTGKLVSEDLVRIKMIGINALPLEKRGGFLADLQEKKAKEVRRSLKKATGNTLDLGSVRSALFFLNAAVNWRLHAERNPKEESHFLRKRRTAFRSGLKLLGFA